MKRLEVIEICAGAGGQSLGLHLAGFQHRLALELDAQAAITLNRNLLRLAKEGESPTVLTGDVADPCVWNPEDTQYRGIDLLAGGVPCPPFSVAGRQLGSQDERDLFAWAVELCGRIQPRAFLLENVRGLASPRFAGYRQAIKDRLDELGYWSEWRLLNASDYGVPQLRPRFVLIALQPDYAPYFHWPRPNASPTTVGQALRELMGVNNWRFASDWVEGAEKIGPTIVGGSKKHGGADLGPTRAKRAWRELGVDALGVADAAPARNDPHPRVKPPRLTCEMVARLQGWDDGEYRWDFVGRKTSVYRQIGNAFPPPVARALGESIADALHMRGEPRTSISASDVHDELYRVLRSANDFLTGPKIASRLVVPVNPDELEQRLILLERDFVLDVRETADGPAWRLGEFKAFRGQATHLRHEVFADRIARARIS